MSRSARARGLKERKKETEEVEAIFVLCLKCKKDIPDGATYCCWCGTSTKPKSQNPKRRGNGQGSAYRVGKTWTAARVFGYIADEKERLVPNKSTKGGFKTKKEALDYLPKLEPKKATKSRHVIPPDITLKEIYDLWLPTHISRGKSDSLKAVYNAAMKHYQDLWDVHFSDLQVDDYQDCIDDCQRGRQTKDNMRTVLGLVYKFALPRGAVPSNLNLASYLYVDGEKGRRNPFTDLEIETIRQSIGRVKYADYIYCMIYLGYRPTEFLTREIAHYNDEEKAIFGGIKTAKGKNRYVTISPKIQPYIDKMIEGRTEGIIFCDEDGGSISTGKFREYFLAALSEMGITTSMERRLTPYSCRHTFASLMDRVQGVGDNAKLELIGHTNTNTLRHYQHSDFEDLRKITNNL